MVFHDMSAAHTPGVTPVRPVWAPGMLLVSRLHVDLCRLASAICPRCSAV